MWPKEHGAYSQLAFPLVTALAVVGVNTAALLVVSAAVAGFLSHEPLLVLLGRRGSRRQLTQHRQAVNWFVVTGLAGMATGLAAVFSAARATQWVFALPLTPAILYGIALATHCEKTTAGELAAAFAFSLVSVPLCVAAGAPPGAGLSIGMTFALLSAAHTLGVRVVILRVRGGGDPHAVAATRWLLAIVVVAMTAALTMLAARGVISWITIGAIVPGVLVSGVLAVRPPPATQLRTVGWTLLSTSAIATVLLVLGLRFK
jgi:YwiC-like protein